MRDTFDRLLGKYRLFWIVLALPGVELIYDRYVNHAPGGQLFYWTGVYAVWLILWGLSITPQMRLFRGATWVRWQMQRRRYIGIAAFVYSALHTLIWLQQEPLAGILASFADPLVLTGWISLFIFIAMAATSNDLSVRRMGPGWKALQRWVYLAAPLALIHWFMAEHYRVKTMLIYGGILAAIVAARLAGRQVRGLSTRRT